MNKRKSIVFPIDRSKESTKTKKRRDDLICLVCGGTASSYNFGQISCHSCKEFFRRNAFLPIETTKCLKNENKCEIRFDIKVKCQRCRLLKCFASGMRQDRVMTRQDKIDKQQRIEENRRLRWIYSEENEEKILHSSMLNDLHRSSLLMIENAYQSALQSSPSASSMISFEFSREKTLSFTTTTEIDQFGAIKLIHFLRRIPQFQSLDEHDRLILVKYNLVLLLGLRDVLIYDQKNQMLYDDDMDETLTPFIRDKFAHCYRSLYILFYGYEESLFYLSNVSFISHHVDNDRLIVQLLMLILIFQQGAAIHDEQRWNLCYSKKIFYFHLEFVELLFRYLIDRYSMEKATMKMLHLVNCLFRIQDSTHRYRQILKGKKDQEINPNLKALLDIS